MGKRLRKPLKKEKTYSEKIVKILSQNANKVYNYKQIAAILDLDDTQSRNQIIKDLKILAAQKTIIESEPGKYLVKADFGIVICGSGNGIAMTVNKHQKVRAALCWMKEIAAQKTIIESEPGKYLVKAISQDYYEGKIDMTGRKTAYFVCPDLEEDVFIPIS